MPAFTAMVSLSTLAGLGIIAVLLGLLRMLHSSRLAGRELDELPECLRSIDVEAFRNLVDPVEQAYLRSHMAGAFTKVQRLRLRAAARYVALAFRNAMLLLHIGEEAQHSADPRVAQAGRELMDSALRLRWYAVLALGRLYAGIVFPGLQLSPAVLTDMYQRLDTALTRLGRLQYPTRGARVSATY